MLNILGSLGSLSRLCVEEASGCFGARQDIWATGRRFRPCRHSWTWEYTYIIRAPLEQRGNAYYFATLGILYNLDRPPGQCAEDAIGLASKRQGTEAQGRSLWPSLGRWLQQPTYAYRVGQGLVGYRSGCIFYQALCFSLLSRIKGCPFGLQTVQATRSGRNGLCDERKFEHTLGFPGEGPGSREEFRTGSANITGGKALLRAFKAGEFEDIDVLLIQEHRQGFVANWARMVEAWGWHVMAAPAVKTKLGGFSGGGGGPPLEGKGAG